MKTSTSNIFKFCHELKLVCDLFIYELIQQIRKFYKQMLRNLTKSLKYSVGFHTDHIEMLLKKFIPTDENSCVNILKKIQEKKEYLGVSQIAQSFVNRIQYTVLHKQKFISSHTIYIYQTLKKLQLLSGSFKYGLYNKLQNQINGILEFDLNIKNTELETLLWFMYRQYPFLRSTKTTQIANEHTLKLFDIVEFMNNEKQLPKWDPYLRVVTLLKDLLGHDIELRNDITREDIQKLPYLYLPFLRNIFDEEEMSRKFEEKHYMHVPFYQYLTEKYIESDRNIHDAYLQYVEVIDNERQGQQIQRYYSTLQWNNFAEFFQLYSKSVEDSGINEEILYKVDQLFWRMCETSNIDIQTAIRIIKLISENPGVMDKYEANMFNRSLDGIKNSSISEYAYIPARAVYDLLISVDSSRTANNSMKKDIFQFSSKIIKSTKIWDNNGEDIQILKEVYTKTDCEVNLDEKIRKILNIN